MKRISIITPTADQPIGMRLLEQYVSQQTVKPYEWIVSDDGLQKANLTMGQIHLKRNRRHEGGASLAANVLAALEHVHGDVVCIMEHDDFYQENHIEMGVRRLFADKNRWATGSFWQRYYNVRTRQYIILRNIGSALCNTMFHVEHLPKLQKAAETAFRKKSYGVDRMFWESIPRTHWDSHGETTMVGMKGLPGRGGLGVGHRPGKGRFKWKNDPKMKILEQWIGEDVRHYKAIEY